MRCCGDQGPIDANTLRRIAHRGDGPIIDWYTHMGSRCDGRFHSHGIYVKRIHRGSCGHEQTACDLANQTATDHRHTVPEFYIGKPNPV